MISVIIPIYNSSLTLNECLESIYGSTFKNFEVIVVSDCSTDSSVHIAKNYNCKIIELDENKGPAYARNIGSYEAKGDILFFVDSDVVIKKNALDHVNNEFSERDINVLQGIYSHEPNYRNIATQYQQSFYCYYTWSKDQQYSFTLVSMCFAIRRKIFLDLKGFNTKIRRATAEDEEFGYNLIDAGNKILISRELNVEHRVNYTLKKFIKRNYNMYFETMKSFLRNKSFIKKMKQRNYSNVLLGVPLIGLVLLSLVLMVFFFNEKTFGLFLILNAIFILLHFNFFKFVAFSKNISTALGIIFTCYLDAFLMLLGVIFANVSYIFGKRY